MASTSYKDMGAVQRPESGAETPKVSYLDIGAVQRREQAAVTILKNDPLVFGAAM